MDVGKKCRTLHFSVSFALTYRYSLNFGCYFLTMQRLRLRHTNALIFRREEFGNQFEITVFPN